jgi:2-polyprenyl-3-methyl-5-hydroxy-6-metoxy-1,4-benzoquinol methylase
MATNYNAIAKEYRASKMLPWRKHVESHTFFDMLGDITNLNILDLACGEGFYTRQLKLRGAANVVGVDISEEMISLADEAEQSDPLGLTYHCQNALSLDLHEKFDIVTATYLLNYARNADELFRMSAVIANHLKPGGRFVTINSNPDYQSTVELLFPYGFTRENSSYAEGAEIIYRFYQSNSSHIEVVNYHLARSTHETVMGRAGLSKVQWHPLKVSRDGINESGETYWEAILHSQPVIGLSCCMS